MNTQTSLATEQIRDCQNCPSNMKVDAWCREHGLTKANYYYRLRRVREACLEFCETPLPSWNLQHQRIAYRKKRTKCISLWLQYFM